MEDIKYTKATRKVKKGDRTSRADRQAGADIRTDNGETYIVIHIQIDRHYKCRWTCRLH